LGHVALSAEHIGVTTGCGAKVALENTRAGQFPDHQLQARFITMFKEHLAGNTQPSYFYRPEERFSSR
ncbi:hypothetical protein, partial [Pseudomonas aeruginosa]